MGSENKQERALEVYRQICGALDTRDWKYRSDESDLHIHTGAQGDDLPMDIEIYVEASKYLVLLLSPLPFVIPEDKRLEMAVLVSAANDMMVDGCFDYDIKTGRTFFRRTICYYDSTISHDVILYMLLSSCKTVDDFNDTFFALSKGIFSMEECLAKINQLGN